MTNRHGDDLPAAPDHQGGQKAMHVVEARHGKKGGAGKHLQSTPGVRRMVLQETGAHAVGDPRRHPFQARIPPLGALAGDHRAVIARSLPGEPGEQLGDVGGVVLPVAVKGDDERRARRLDAAEDGRALALAGAVAHPAQAGVPGGKGGEAVRSPVAAAVVHVDDLVLGASVEGGGDFVDQGAQVLGLVQNRHDDRECRRAR